VSFILQVVAIYFGFLLALAFIGALAALAVKYKIQPISGPMMVAGGLLFITFGVGIWYFLERKP